MYIKNKTTSNTVLEEIEGTVQGHRDGHGFVLRDDGQPDIYLPANEMRAVLHRDRVKVRIVRHDRRGRPEGHVVEIVERPPHPIIGRLLLEGGVWLVAPEDKRYGQDVLLPKGATGQAQPGQVVVVELTEPPALFGQPVGRVKEVLGEVDDPGMEIEIAVRKYGVPHVFSDACLAAARSLPDSVRATDARERVDLTDVPLVTIDGEDARDFDDAVYAVPAVVRGRGKKPNGWRLLVAIADVSHYVRTGEPIDVDAYDRATSVYFPRRVIPMLPEKLSNGLCSLNPEVDRLCMVCDMLVDDAGETLAYQFYPAVMRSHARLTYTEVAAILTNTRGPEASRRQAQVADLLHLHDAYRALLKARGARGAVDFDTTETQIVCDDSGQIERIVPRVRTEAHRLIEECMLAANVCAADFIAQHRRAALYRVHEGPTPEKAELLRNYLKSVGIGAALSDEPTPAELQAIAEVARERADAQQIQTMLLRSMQQAIYTPVNSGHFGLAFDAYAHFTSPIRRYPDLLVHRVIKAILAGKPYHLPALPTPGEAQAKLARRLQKRGGAAPDEGPEAERPRSSAEQQAWQAAGLHCSANERRADEASRDVEAWLKCKYMREHLGEEFVGSVSAVTSFGLFVTLQDMYVEGLVHITELGGEYFRFDEVRQELRGERTGIRYSIGTRVQVQVSRVDLDGRRIDFRLVPAFDERAAQGGHEGAGRRKGGGRGAAGAPHAGVAPRDDEGAAPRAGRSARSARPEKSARSGKSGPSSKSSKSGKASKAAKSGKAGKAGASASSTPSARPAGAKASRSRR